MGNGLYSSAAFRRGRRRHVLLPETRLRFVRQSEVQDCGVARAKIAVKTSLKLRCVIRAHYNREVPGSAWFRHQAPRPI